MASRKAVGFGAVGFRAVGFRAVGLGAVGALVITGAGWLVLHRPAPVPTPTTASGLGTATVVRTNVIAHDIVTGSLGYLDPVTIVGGAQQGGTRQGTITWLPAPGTVIGTDQRLYEVDGRPVVLWQGDRPAWRDLTPGMPAGPDVAQAEQNLGRRLTGTAIRRWQARHGLPQTGAIAVGQVVFQPGPVRIAAVPAALGSPVGPGTPILTTTSTRKAVSVQLDPNRQTVVHPGDKVTIRHPRHSGHRRTRRSRCGGRDRRRRGPGLRRHRRA